MGIYKCAGCGNIRESRCKPKKCKECGGSEFERQDAPGNKKGSTVPGSKCER